MWSTHGYCILVRAKEGHVEVMMVPNNFEPIQYNYNASRKTGFTTDSDSATDEDKSMEEDEHKHASQQLRANGLFVSSNGAFLRVHKAHKPTSESTAEEPAPAISSTADELLDQGAQTTNPSHGTRIPKLLLTTLLSQQLRDNLVVSELPPEMDADHMNVVYNMVSVPVPDSLSFKQRFTSLLRHFVQSHQEPEQKAEPTIFVLTPVNNSTVKMITLAEKLKRDLDSCGVKCFQYCSVQSRMDSVKHTKSVKRNRKGKPGKQDETTECTVASAAAGLDVEACNDNDEEEAFQKMNIPYENVPKVATSENWKLRRVPVMTIFLALAPVPELRQIYELESLRSICIDEILRLTACAVNKQIKP